MIRRVVNGAHISGTGLPILGDTESCPGIHIVQLEKLETLKPHTLSKMLSNYIDNAF